ncbi:MAG: DUF433 domain-containing protein [Tunicatimonas sp.]|uniref:DUF433 domain-containing protein n=1 Tax=Tunicatimonas sp. TaxID=1940096 RepID=UPI003C790CE9
MSAIALNDHIESTPDVVGGKPRIAGRRITVEDIVIWHERMGESVDEIATKYKLTLSDVYAALTYYYDHQSEIDQSIREGKVWVNDLRSKTISKLEKRAL